MSYLETGKSIGIVEAIQKRFEEIGAENELKRIISFGADGSNVNKGQVNGAIPALKELYGEWIIYIWCISHRLERLEHKRSIKWNFI